MSENRIPVVAHVKRSYLARTETFVGNQIVTLEKYRPIVLCNHQIDGHSYPRDDVISVIDILTSGRRSLNKLFYRSARILTPAASNALVKHTKTLPVSLIHFHYLVDARFFLRFRRGVCVPALVSAYGYDVSCFPRMHWGYGKRYIKPLFNELELFIAMSQDMRRDLINLGCPEEKIVVHYHGIDTKRFVYPEREYADKDRYNILVCGTLEVKKAQHLVLKALQRMKEQRITRRPFHVTFVGDGPMRPHLEKQVADYGWEDIVTFTGFIPYGDQRLIDEYRRADIFSLPSITTSDGDKEGIPGTIVEAMASGLPVISTYHAGIPEVIESGRHGILVKENDTDAMACAFADLIDNTKLQKELGCAAAFRAIGELDLRVKTKNLERIYDSLLDAKELKEVF